MIMPVPKSLKVLIGTKFDPESDEEKAQLYEAAAWQGIRLCKIFAQTRSNEGNSVKVHNQNLSHYFSGFSRLNIEAREWYANSILKSECGPAFKLLERAQEKLKAHMDEDDITQDDLLKTMAELTGEAMEDMQLILEELQAGTQRGMNKLMGPLERKCETGRIYPWDHIYYKIKRINLPDLPKERYKGPSLNVHVSDGVITEMNLSR